MAVEVVGGEVEEDRALGREGDAVLELEAGGLADHRGVRVDLAGERGERRADVAGDRDRLAGGPVEVAEQLGGGRLAVGPGDGEEAVGDRPPGQLELADHVDPALQRGRDHRRLPGHARALDDGPRPIQLSQSIRIQDDFDACPRKPCRPLGMAGIDRPHASPRAASSRAAALPERARPTTRKGPRAAADEASRGRHAHRMHAPPRPVRRTLSPARTGCESARWTAMRTSSRDSARRRAQRGRTASRRAPSSSSVLESRADPRRADAFGHSGSRRGGHETQEGAAALRSAASVRRLTEDGLVA